MKEKISSQNLAENRTDTKYSLVYICSPLRPVSPDVSAHPDELKANLRLACDACTFAAVRGFIPVAPHLYFPQFLDDNKPMERTLGMNMGLELLRKCEALWIVSRRISYGITAFVLVFPPRNEAEKYIVVPHFWLPRETLELRVRRDKVPYDVWEKQGLFHITDGNVVDYNFVRKTINELYEIYNIKEVAYDRWNAQQLIIDLEGDGFTMVPFGQGYRDLSPPSKELMKLTLEQKLAHNGHPVLRWNMDNIFVRTDPAGNIKPDKEKSTEKIDGAVATIMALDRAIRCGSQSDESVYDTRDLILL